MRSGILHRQHAHIHRDRSRVPGDPGCRKVVIHVGRKTFNKLTACRQSKYRRGEGAGYSSASDAELALKPVLREAGHSSSSLSLRLAHQLEAQQQWEQLPIPHGLSQQPAGQGDGTSETSPV